MSHWPAAFRGRALFFIRMSRRLQSSLKPLLKMPAVWIGGRASFTPPLLALAQVDGSYKAGRGAAAVWIETAAQDRIDKKVYQLGDIDSSTEAEWAAVYAGVFRCLELREGALILENDCLGVMNTLMQRDVTIKKEYARYYYWKIKEGAKTAEWIGIRWIPRAYNQADSLFQRSKI